MRKILKYGAFGAAVLLAGAQFFQPARTNPPEVPAATFEAVAETSPEVKAIIQWACRDCHSNSTVWPWYSRFAPVSWMVADHVREGRARLNFSEWNLYGPDMSRLRLKEACQQVQAGEMPVWSYRLMHPEARLTVSDVRALCADTGSPTPGSLAP